MDVEISIVDAIRAIDQLRLSHRALRAERDQLRRKLAEAEAQRDSWRAEASR